MGEKEKEKALSLESQGTLAQESFVEGEAGSAQTLWLWSRASGGSGPGSPAEPEAWAAAAQPFDVTEMETHTCPTIN